MNRQSPDLPLLEYVPEGWKRQVTDPKVTGWNVESILAAQQATWPELVKALEGNQPLGIAPEATHITNTNFAFHNVTMSYAYVLARTARNTGSISILDWGGGLGQYCLIGKAALPDVHLDYSCKELPLLAEQGRKLLPEATFFDDDSYLEQRYDLVMASGSLQYVEDWKALLGKLVSVTGKYLYLTRIPVVRHAPSFVVVQRPYKMGYDTEYLSWHLNRDELMESVHSNGFKLVREFLIGEYLSVHHAPEQTDMRGFLFEPIEKKER